MTDQQRNQILTLRAKGRTFTAISDVVGIPAGTIKSFCSRNKNIEAPVPKTTECVCAYCGSPIVLTPGSRAKRFCDRSCYIRWWHAQGTHQATTYHKVCANCGKPFTVAVKKTQKYCSAACYQEARKASGKWTLVGFYVDKGGVAPRMENAPEWSRLLEDCMAGKVDLIITQKVSNVSKDVNEITFCARMLASLPHPVGIYFDSEEIFTTASYYMQDLRDSFFLAQQPDAIESPPIGGLLHD
ncbi:MAG: recombinase family protein [Clostridiales bacterium]|nr:recombinase family protein [Clostridiales bacterium]